TSNSETPSIPPPSSADASLLTTATALLANTTPALSPTVSPTATSPTRTSISGRSSPSSSPVYTIAARRELVGTSGLPLLEASTLSATGPLSPTRTIPSIGLSIPQYTESALSSLVAALKAYKALRSLVDQALVPPTVAATTTTTYEAAVINFIIAGLVPGS
ncbi:hypothetical protein E2P81_ATG10036, partial [Venturia nashicola]